MNDFPANIKGMTEKWDDTYRAMQQLDPKDQ